MTDVLKDLILRQQKGATRNPNGTIAAYDPEPNRELVRRLAGLQISQAEVCLVIGIAPHTLREHHRDDFDMGKTIKGVKLRDHAYDFAFGVLNDPDDPKSGWRIPPDPKMVQFLLERQFGMIPQSRSEVTMTEITPEAAEWLGQKTS